MSDPYLAVVDDEGVFYSDKEIEVRLDQVAGHANNKKTRLFGVSLKRQFSRTGFLTVRQISAVRDICSGMTWGLEIKPTADAIERGRLLREREEQDDSN